MKILLIEDDPVMANSLKAALKRFYVVEVAYTGEEGEYKTHANEYGLLLIDYSLPDTNGIEIARKLRNEGVLIPIIMLTGTDVVTTKIQALNSGIDDYIVKPFDIDELRARIEAVLRRYSTQPGLNILRVEDLTFNLHTREVQRGEKLLKLKRKQMDLLEYLMRNAGTVVTRLMILDHVWDSSQEIQANVVDVHIKYLRDQIDRDFPKKLIQTIHGYGYKLKA